MSDSSISMIFRLTLPIDQRVRATYAGRPWSSEAPSTRMSDVFWHDYVWSEEPSVLLDSRFLFAMRVTRRIERMSAFASASRWNDAR